MSLYCLAGRVYSSAWKAQFSVGLKKEFLKPSAAVRVLGQPYHRRLAAAQNRSEEKCRYACNLHSTPLGDVVKSFSTSASRLAEHKGHDHSKMWTLERILCVSLLPLVPAALLAPSQPLDTALALAIVLHTHFGLEAIVVDYIRPILFGNLAPKIGLGLLFVFSIVTFGGLLNLIYNDTGLANTILQVWKK